MTADDVYRMIDSMDAMKPFLFSTRLLPENAKYFLLLLKDHIAHDYGKDKGFFMEISSDYTSCRKILYTNNHTPQ